MKSVIYSLLYICLYNVGVRLPVCGIHKKNTYVKFLILHQVLFFDKKFYIIPVF